MKKTMEHIGKEWLWRRIYLNKLNGRDSLVPRAELEKVKTKENADELFEHIINDTSREWNFGIFIAHMEEMRGQLQGRDYQKHKEWVFNTHPEKIPSFKELLRVVLVLLVRCCTKVLL